MVLDQIFQIHSIYRPPGILSDFSGSKIELQCIISMIIEMNVPMTFTHKVNDKI